MQETNCCSECFRKNPVSENNKCSICRQMSVTAEFSGPSLILKCHHCGNTVVGDGFYAPCEQCYERFVVIVNRIPLSNMVAAGKCIHRGVVEIKRTLDRGEPVIIENLNLDEALLMLRSLQSLDCDCESKPDPSEMFPDILNCTAWIPISRL